MAVSETLKQLGKIGIDDLRSYTLGLFVPDCTRSVVWIE